MTVILSQLYEEHTEAVEEAESRDEAEGRALVERRGEELLGNGGTGAPHGGGESTDGGDGDGQGGDGDNVNNGASSVGDGEGEIPQRPSWIDKIVQGGGKQGKGVKVGPTGIAFGIEVTNRYTVFTLL
jgi:hypothetical protein